MGRSGGVSGGIILVLTILCVAMLLLITMVVWMTVVHLRVHRDAAEVVPLEVAVCIRKNNGDIVIRQRRGKGVLGLAVGLFMVIGGLAMPVIQVLNAAETELLPTLCMGLGLLVFGALVMWVSARGFREPHVVIEPIGQTVRLRYAGPKRAQEWPFDAIVGVTKQMRIHEDMLVGVTDFLITIAAAAGGSHAASGSGIERTAIGLRHADGQTVHICTATGKAARRVPEMIAAAINKPVLTG
jgi:hypothetical protein